MNESTSGIAEMALRHLAELEKSIDRAVKGRADWGTILALKAAARVQEGTEASRRIVKKSSHVIR